MTEWLSQFLSFHGSQSNHPFFKYLYLEIWPWKSQVKVMGSKVSSQMIADEQGKSTGVESSDRPSNLTQTGFKLSIFGQSDLEIRWMTSKNNRAPLLYYIKHCASFQSHLLIQTRVTVWECSLRVKIRDVFVPCDLEIWQMTLKNNRHLFCATSTFMHHFIAISVFKLELQSGNAQFRWKLMIFFCPVWPWNTIRHLLYATWSFVHYLGAISEFKLELTVQKCPIWVKIEDFFMPSDLEICHLNLKNNRTPVLCHVKLCVSSYRHMWIQTGFRVRKRLNWILTSVTLTFDLDLFHGHHFCQW